MELTQCRFRHTSSPVEQRHITEWATPRGASLHTSQHHVRVHRSSGLLTNLQRLRRLAVKKHTVPPETTQRPRIVSGSQSIRHPRMVVNAAASIPRANGQGVDGSCCSEECCNGTLLWQSHGFRFNSS